METRRWVPGESFTGSVVRLQEEVDAHLVVLVARRPPTLTSSSRLVLLPHERIARQLRVPVLTMPYDGSDTGFEEAPPDAPRRSLLDRLRRRGADPLEPAGGEDAGATPDRPAPVAPAPVGPGTAADPIALQVGRGELTSDPPGGRPS
jgi:hypothetical protein